MLRLRVQGEMLVRDTRWWWWRRWSGVWRHRACVRPYLDSRCVWACELLPPKTWGWNLAHHEFKGVNSRLSVHQQEQTCPLFDSLALFVNLSSTSITFFFFPPLVLRRSCLDQIPRAWRAQVRLCCTSKRLMSESKTVTMTFHWNKKHHYVILRPHLVQVGQTQDRSGEKENTETSMFSTTSLGH